MSRRVTLSFGEGGRICGPWERQKGESRQAYEAFRHYLDSALRGRPSIRKTAERLDKSRQLLEGWSKKWSWVKRVDQCVAVEDRLKMARACAEAEEQGRIIAQRNREYTEATLDEAILNEATLDEDSLLRVAFIEECDLETLAGLVGIDEPLPSLGLGESTLTVPQENADPGDVVGQDVGQEFTTAGGAR